MPDYRMVLFIDYQNAYMGARQVFFGPGSFHTCGQFDPLKLGQAIASRDVTRTKRRLTQVRLYTGRPSSTHDPKGYGAHMRQCAGWTKQGVVVVPRTLRYPRDYPRARPEEKGIDVQLAIDFVMMKQRDEYDVGVIFSSDTDLLPALEGVSELTDADKSPLPEVANWGEPRTGRSRLRVRDRDIRCHWIDRKEHMVLSDRTDYNIKPGS